MMEKQLASNVKISGFGVFDGSYVIEKATHSIGSAYTTKLDLSMGKESKKALRNKNSKKSRKNKANVTNDLVYTGENYYHSGKVKILNEQ